MVKTTTPEVILRAFYFPEAQQVKAVNICFITPQQTIYHLRTQNIRTRISDTQMHS